MTDSEEEDAFLVCIFGQAAQFIIENETNENNGYQRIHHLRHSPLMNNNK